MTNVNSSVLVFQVNAVAAEIESVCAGESDMYADIFEWVADQLEIKPTYWGSGEVADAEILVTCGGPRLSVWAQSGRVCGSEWNSSYDTRLSLRARSCLMEAVSEFAPEPAA